MKVLSILSSCLLVCSVSFSQVNLRAWPKSPDLPDLIPIPQSILMGTGHYVVPEPLNLVNYLTMQWFAGEYPTEKKGTPDIRTELLTMYDTLLGAEGYQLQISSSGILIRANHAAGLFYGHQTLRQIVMQFTDQTNGSIRLPYLYITDFPAFKWRGMLLDCCRHFMEKDFILRYIDLLAFYKMNVFHWHLTEDQGWRIQIDKYPLLTEVGGWRRESDGSLYGGFYTRQEIREVVAYAAARQITVVPEIEMPGHAMAALAAYPSLSCTGGPFEVPTTWGVFKDIYCAGNDSVFTFLKDVLDEVLELFPSEYIHIGGDEAPKYHWEHCPKCQKRMAAHNLKDEHTLQSWFIEEIAVYLKSKGRKLIGWDEIIEGGLVDGVTVQSWQSFEGARHAAETGNDAVVSPTSHAYFDYPVHKLTLEKVYQFDPVPDGLDASLHHHILGGECNMWTERTPQHLVDQKVFPRILAMAEVLWSDPPKTDSILTVEVGRTKIDKPKRDYAQFRARVRKHYPILNALGVNYGLEEGGLKIATARTSEGMLVTMTPEQNNITIRYSLGPDSLNHDMIYRNPIPVTEKLTIHAAAYIGGQRVSEVFTREYNIHSGTGYEYTLSRKPGGTYNKNPQTTLTDGIRGTTDFHDGLWLGFWEKDVSISFSFDDPQTLNKVVIGFLQSNPSWIFLPAEVTVTIAPEGFLKRKIRYQINSKTQKETLTTKENFSVNLEKPVRIRKLTIHVKNPGTCPDWHPGAGSPTWIFIDEVLIM